MTGVRPRPIPRGRLSRRALLSAGGLGGVVAVGAGVLNLPDFEGPAARPAPATCATTDLSNTDKALVVSNWPRYIDPRNDGPTNTRDMFEQRTGIKVQYADDVNDNAEFFAEVRNRLGSCRGVDRDMFVLTDWMAARMIGLGWIQPLDAARVPNLHHNLIDSLRGRTWDPDLAYHAPWQSGLTGIAYNAAKTGEVGSFSELLTRPDLKGKVTLLSEMRDTMGFMLRVVGADPRNFDEDDWANALDRLRRAVGDGHVRAFSGNDYMDELSAGSIVACEAWSGDVISAQFDNPDIKFVTPEEGLALWSDNMLVPNLASHRANAEAWVDYYYEPEVAAVLASWVHYICPVKGAREAMVMVKPDLVDNPLIFPDDDLLAATFDFMPLTEFQTTMFEGDWSDVLADAHTQHGTR